MLNFIAGVFVGSVCAIVTMCVMITGKRAEEGMERMKPKEARRPLLMDKSNCIHFLNSKKEELFCIPDGGSIELAAGDGESKVSICHYLDAEHAEIDGIKWQMEEFAIKMEQRGITYVPLLN